MYYCHECERDAIPNNTDGLRCRFCASEFIEEVERPEQQPANQQPNINTFVQYLHTNLHNGANMPGGVVVNQMQFNIGQGGNAMWNTVEMNDMANALFNQLQNGGLFGGLAGGNGAFTTLDDLLARSMEDGHRAPPPASVSAVSKLNEQTVDDAFASKHLDCGVCKENYKHDDSVLQLPCNHYFHKDCLMPWLNQTNTCPLCRFELPTDDADYENAKKAKESSTTNDA
mmetsp:Transcript_1535/g.1729  ORF Transcript_1535/g.1729 Transcript_1535/m.1729 type:complete len:228 (+) Transcript_1535:41-724(+)